MRGSDLIKRELSGEFLVVGPDLANDLLDLGESLSKGDTVNKGVLSNEGDNLSLGLGVSEVARNDKSLGLSDEVVPGGSNSLLVSHVGLNPFLIPAVLFSL